MSSAVHNLTTQAGFVFEAKLEELGASTAGSYAATPETAVVSVTRILKGPPALAGYVGQRITVHLQPPVNLKAGQQAVFFTHGVHYGDSMVVQELGNVPGGAANVEADVTSAVQAGSDTEMTQRLAEAELVISGTASAPVPYAAPVPVAGRRISEHDPDWWSTTVTVESVEKGQNPGPTKQVLFPHSLDIAWYNSPKVKEGDRGVWLLHNRDKFGKAVPAHAVVHHLDFRPITELEHVRNLVKGTPQ